MPWFGGGVVGIEVSGREPLVQRTPMETAVVTSYSGSQPA